MRFASKICALLFVLLGFQTANAEWTKLKTNTLAWLRAIHFVDEQNGWIVGSKGTYIYTNDSGKTWRLKPNFTKDTITDIYFLDKNTGWLLCERDVFSLGTKSPSYLLKTTDGGKTWKSVEFENEQRQKITSLFFAKSGYGLAAGETGALFGLQDDNSTWKKLPPPTRYLILDGTFIDGLRGVIVGGGGSVYFTEDAGTTWNLAHLSEKTSSRLNSVFFTNAKNGWIAGAGGKIYQTFNGGRRWRLQNTNVTANLNDVYFSDTAKGWAVGDEGTLLETTTGGNVWRKVRSRSSNKLEKVLFSGHKGWVIGFGGTVLYFDPTKDKTAALPRFEIRNSSQSRLLDR